VAPLTAAAVTCAVALVTRQALEVDVPREDLLGDVEADEALRAMEAVTAGVLSGVWPRDNGAGVLERIGVAIAELGETLPAYPQNVRRRTLEQRADSRRQVTVKPRDTRLQALTGLAFSLPGHPERAIGTHSPSMNGNP